LYLSEEKIKEAAKYKIFQTEAEKRKKIEDRLMSFMAHSTTYAILQLLLTLNRT